jgi:hypothetical protein
MKTFTTPWHPVTRGIVMITVTLLAACTGDGTDITAPEVSYARVKAGGGGKGGQTPLAVNGADPSNVPRGSINAQIHVFGSGFTSGSEVSFELDGTETTTVVTNAVQFVDETHLVATVDVSLEAIETFYDIAVRNGPKKRGVGIDLLRVSEPAPANPEIVYSGGSPYASIVVVDADGSHQTTVLAGDGNVDPAISPDRSRIAYRQDGALILLDLEVVDGVPVASNPVQLGTGYVSSVEWSPDGRELVGFCSDATMVNPDHGICVWAADGSGRELAAVPENEDVRLGSPTWSPDGSSIAFVVVDVTSQNQELRAIRVVDRSDGTVLADRAVHDLPSAWGLSWQRTLGGTLVALHARYDGGKRKEPMAVHLVDPFSTAPSQFIAVGVTPTWSPDDTELAYVTGGDSDLVAFDLATGSTRLIAKGVDHPDWKR